MKRVTSISAPARGPKLTTPLAACPLGAGQFAMVTRRRGLHVSAPVGASAKVNPRNMNQAALREMQSIDAVRKRHEEMRKQKQLEEAEAAGTEEVKQDFYVRLAYKELAEEEERLRNPGKWRDLEQRRAVMDWKNKQLKGKTLRAASRTSQRNKHLSAEHSNYEKAAAMGGDDDMDG